MRRLFPSNFTSRHLEPLVSDGLGTMEGDNVNGSDLGRSRELFQNLPIACFLFDRKGAILLWNRAAEALYGWSTSDDVSRTVWGIIERPEDAARVRKQVERVFAGEAIRELEWQVQCSEDHTCHVAVDIFPLHNEHDQIATGVCAGIHIGERKRAEERLVRHAFHDRLTNLPDRTLFLEQIEAALKRAQQNNDYEFAVFFLNLDRFKVANESLGHGAGDQLLISTARKLEACIAPGDTVARLGGDEFAVLLDGLKSEDDAIQVAERIQKRLGLSTNVGGQEVFSSASIGVAFSRKSHARAEDVLRDAHAAMDRAKAGGKARYEVFEKGLPSRTRSILQIEADLRRALGRQELHMEYQPIVSLATGLIDGFEALVRWNHPTRGAISPGQFIPLAEETGLIIPIGYWALREACNQLAQWQKNRRQRALPVTISVNLSARQFSQRNLLEQVLHIITRSSVDPSYLKLEITESAIMDNTEAAIETVTHLKEVGIKISLDDFGTGYSSLSYLHRFPFNVLKIDQAFVSRMDVSAKNEEIVRAIIALGHSLNMDVIAEGVETAPQLSHLRALKCHYGQGYFFAAGMDAKTATELIAANPQW
jgi:diguanylate cyclase (GGDEF)-like protein/PAS domain S-box-containing protein